MLIPDLRVHILRFLPLALEYKSIEYDCKPVDLSNGEQYKSEYKEINSLNQVPALVANGVVVTQSMAILEFLEEFFPEKPRLLPTDPVQKAKVREICEVHSVCFIRNA